jgi:DNA-binding NarL/FixJ family response regulator
MTVFLPLKPAADLASPGDRHEIGRVAPGDGRLPIRVILVSETRLLREGLARILNESGRATVVAVAEGADEALRATRHTPHDIVLLDASSREAFNVTRTLRQSATPATIVGIAVEDTDEAVLAFAETGVAAYTLRSAALGDLVATLEAVIRGESHCSPRVAGSLLRRVAMLASVHTLADVAERPPSFLTARERDIAALINRGMSNKAIAEHLQIGVSTVKNHVHHILEKLRVGHRRDVVRHLRSHAEPERKLGT